MRLTFLSNYYNHHQKYISKEFNEIVDSYRFVSTSEMREERKVLGYGETVLPEYVCAYEANPDLINQRIYDSDVVLIGAAPNDLVRSRIKHSKCVFRYAERPFKKKDTLIKYLPRFIQWHISNPPSRPIYLLCASAYTAYDYSRYGLYKDKVYKWGYFPETKYYDIDRALENKSANTILWCGRFLDWKHPDDAIEIAKRLKTDGRDFEMKIIGIGVMERELMQRVAEAALDDCVTFLGSMRPEQVRTHMEQAGIYLFTSDRKEGWGVVLNESMNSGCAVVASHAIGSVPYLIDDGENGFVYKCGDVDMLYEKVRCLLDAPEEQKRLGRNAYRTITETWNAKVAAERFVKLASRILTGEQSPVLYEDGPCSQAEIIKDDWFNG